MLAVGVGNVRRTVYKCIGLGLFVRVGKRRREKFRIFAPGLYFDGSVGFFLYFLASSLTISWVYKLSYQLNE